MIEKNKEQIKERLRRIANFLLLNSGAVNNIGMLNGKMGIAIFLYHYARFTGDKIFEESAGDLIDEMYEQINTRSSVDYANGLSGFGVGIEYLVRNRFIDAETDEVLENIDKEIQHNIEFHTPRSLDMCGGVTGLGKYIVERLNLPVKKSQKDISKLNKESLLFVLKILSNQYNSYYDILSAVHFLSEAYMLDINKEKVESYLYYAIDKLETMVYEDIHFGIYPTNFNPVNVAATLIRASEKTNNNAFVQSSVHFLDSYESDFRMLLGNKLDNLESGSLKWCLLYNYLGSKLNNEKYMQLSEDWLAEVLNEKKDTVAGLRVETINDVPSLGLMNGYAGIGMGLLSLIGECSADWYSLIPWYIEKERNIQLS